MSDVFSFMPYVTPRSTYTYSQTPAYSTGTSAGASSAASSLKPVSRLAGATRYETMAQIVERGFSESDWVVVASGANFPDALSAIALAGAHNAPVVLSTPHALSPEAQSEIGRLGSTHAVIVGGEAAVSAQVESALKALVQDVTRVAGADRASMSVDAMRATRAARLASDTVVVATGSSFADALSAGAWAYRTASPILLAANGALTPEAIQAIRADAGIRRIIICGGTAAVSDQVYTQLGASYTFERLGGADRYETSAKIASFACGQGLGWTSPVVATGHDFADALAGSAFAGKMGAPLLLLDATSGPTLDALKANKAAISSAYVLGGTSAVPSDIESAVRSQIS